MSAISATVVNQPRKVRVCDNPGCARQMGPHVRLYGAAHEGDPKYVLRICPWCAVRSQDPKVQAALAAAGKDGNQ